MGTKALTARAPGRTAPRRSPSSKTANRKLARLCALANGGGRDRYWPRGRALGGSSTINFMLHVRGDPKGYDEWANKHGCGPEWSFKACEEFFMCASERPHSRQTG